MPGPVAGAALLGAGNLIGMGAGAAAARRSNRILADGSRQQNRAGMEGAAVMGDFLSQLRNSAPNPAAERGAFTGAIGPGAVGGLPTASRQFGADARGATAGAQGYGRNLADLFARLRAPGLQRQQESELLMDAGSALKPIQMRADDDQFLTQLRAGSVKPNPWTQMLGSGLSQAGQYMIGGG